MITKDTTRRRAKIKATIRKKISGTAERPRLTVYRSLGNIYGQIIDDTAGKTLVAVSSISKELKEQVAAIKSKKAKSGLVGKIIAKKALEKNITNVVFDRNGLLYHGRVKALADGAREGGLKF
ncbi:MAG TPA: 50S ribosomal protein L18 [Bacteroidota bacterium]|nr:50S ribosomal protein L18 [Bacteroidota bacterium]